jgi:SAM-dependent methyltransferase
MLKGCKSEMLGFLNKIINFRKVQSEDVSSQHRDFSFESGERQTGKKLDDIRYDHRARYNLPINFLRHNFKCTDKLFGLDMFSGNGYGTYMLFKKLDSSLLGIEGSKEAVTFAIEHYGGKKILFAHKCFPFELPPKTFDFITCMESLEHVENSILMVEQLVKSLKKNGYLFLSTPNKKCISYLINPNLFHYKHFTKEEIVETMENKHGMELLNWYGQDIYMMDNGKVSGELREEEMDISEKEEKQVLIYIFKKNNRG